jgi:hypothetical protein
LSIGPGVSATECSDASVMNLGRRSSKNSKGRDIHDVGQVWFSGARRVACDEILRTCLSHQNLGRLGEGNVGLEVAGKPRSISDTQSARGHALIAHDGLKKLGVP